MARKGRVPHVVLKVLRRPRASSRAECSVNARCELERERGRLLPFIPAATAAAMATGTPYSSRLIVDNYIWEKLCRRGVAHGLHPHLAGGATPTRNGLPPGTPEAQEACAALRRVLREAGDLMERRYLRDFAHLTAQVNLSPPGARGMFSAVIEELFRDAVNWGRIVAFLEFGGGLCVECVNRDMPQQVEHIASWMTDYLNGPLQTWIQENGGWEAFVELYDGQTDSVSNGSCPNLKTVFGLAGLAALGAIGVTVGAYFAQK
ncbi:apoptosis regulator Bcl-2-like [Arapaima gigas]